MNSISARIAAAALAALLAAVPVAAQTSPAAKPAPAPAAKGQDPNQMICEKQEVIGSRLATRRVCMTRAEWADRKLQDRQEVERVQVQRGAIGE